MTDKEMAEDYAEHNQGKYTNEFGNLYHAFLAGLKVGRPKWHKIFKGYPSCVEYWDIPQDTLPKNENFYFVKLKKWIY